MAHKAYAQYRQSTKLLAVMAIDQLFADEFIEAAQDIANSYDIDNNSGVQLDVIGALVNADRTYLTRKTFSVNCCNANAKMQAGNKSSQCVPKYLVGDDDLSDKWFRIIIKAAIAKLISDATTDSILDNIQLIDDSLEISGLGDSEEMSFAIYLKTAPTGIIKDLLFNTSVIPKPQGVEFSGYLDLSQINCCNSSGTVQCGNKSSQCAGYLGV